MDVISAIIILTLFHIFKHKLKSKSYIDDTYNYAFAGKAIWSKKPLEQLLFDVAAQASTASSPPFYPSLYRFLISKSRISPLAVQSFFDWLTQVVTFLIVTKELSIIPAGVTIIVYNLSTLVFKDTLYYTDRLWATMLLWVNLWSLSIFLMTGQYFYLGLAVISYALLVISHKHSLQMLLIIYIILSSFYLTPIFVSVFILGEIIILAVTRGYSGKIHKEHINLLRFSWRFLFPKGPGGYGQDQLLFIRKNRPSQDCRLPFAHRVFHHVIASWDSILFGGISALCITSVLFNGIGRAFEFYLIVFATILITALLTQFIKKLKFIGEGYRYLQYAAFPAIMAVWPIIADLNPTQTLIIVVFFAIWVMGAIYLNIKTLRATANNVINLMDNDFNRLVEEIRDREWDHFIILPIQKTYAFAWLTGKKILHFLGARGFWQARDWFPQILRPLPTFYDEYRIDHIVLDERYVNSGEIELGEVREIFRVNSWVVFKVTHSREVSSP